MQIEFDKKKCLALLKEKKKLSEEGKFFWNVDETKDMELTNYLTLLDDQVFWQSRKEYCQILDLFVSKKIALDELFKQFYCLRGQNLKASKRWEDNLEAEACGILPKSSEIDFQLNPESRKFTTLIFSIHEFLELCNPDITLDMNLKNPELIWYGISEEFLRIYLKEHFLPRIVKYCKESKIPCNISLLTKII